MKRPIYILTDNINSKTYDRKRNELLKTLLIKDGFEAVNYAVGVPEAYFKILKDPTLPDNLLMVEIAQG